MTAWELAESFMTNRQITDDSKTLGCVLKALHTAKITHADTGFKGTQLKATLKLDGEQLAVFKPKWYNRDYIMVGTPYAGKDRHNAEIAAFHLNRIIGLHRVPIVVGRVIDMESEIRSVAHRNLLQTFYYKDGNTCFYGKCYYCKGPDTGVCGTGTDMEGSVTFWLPDSYRLSKPEPHPWRRTYRDNKPAPWEHEKNYCQRVRATRPYESRQRLLDLIDIAIFDFLAGNADRHHYETFEYSKDSAVIALDNGKSFGNPYNDEMTILAPLYQCCMVRKSIYIRLTELSGDIIGQILYNVLADEPLRPVLTSHHYTAVDRRLAKVLQVITECQSASNQAEVVIDDLE